MKILKESKFNIGDRVTIYRPMNISDRNLAGEVFPSGKIISIEGEYPGQGHSYKILLDNGIETRMYDTELSKKRLEDRNWYAKTNKILKESKISENVNMNFLRSEYYNILKKDTIKEDKEQVKADFEKEYYRQPNKFVSSDRWEKAVYKTGVFRHKVTEWPENVTITIAYTENDKIIGKFCENLNRGFIYSQFKYDEKSLGKPWINDNKINGKKKKINEDAITKFHKEFTKQTSNFQFSHFNEWAKAIAKTGVEGKTIAEWPDNVMITTSYTKDSKIIGQFCRDLNRGFIYSQYRFDFTDEGKTIDKDVLLVEDITPQQVFDYLNEYLPSDEGWEDSEAISGIKDRFGFDDTTAQKYFKLYKETAIIESKDMTASEERKARNIVNNEIDKMIRNVYFEFLPIKNVEKILADNGFDTTNLEGIYTGRSGKIHEQVGKFSWISLSWYKMESGKYEIVANVS